MRNLARRYDIEPFLLDLYEQKPEGQKKGVDVFVMEVKSIHLIPEVTFPTCGPLSLHKDTCSFTDFPVWEYFPPSRNPTCWSLRMCVCENLLFSFQTMLSHGD